MTLNFTSFSIKDILTGRHVRGPAGDMSTGGHGPSKSSAGKLSAGVVKCNLSLGDFQQDIPFDILSGCSEDANTLSNAKGEQQMDVLFLVLWSLTNLQSHPFLSLKL